MKSEYDFSKAKRGAVLRSPPGKTRITIRIDDDLLAWFREQVERAGGGNYQTLINTALREYLESRRMRFEDMIRKVIREELRAAGPRTSGRFAVRARKRTATTTRRGELRKKE